MSKILDALKKTQQAKTGKYTTVLKKNGSAISEAPFTDFVTDKVSQPRISFFQISLIAGIAAIGIFSTVLSHKTLSEVRKNKAFSAIVFQQMADQQGELRALNKKMLNSSQELESHIKDLNAELQMFSQEIQISRKEISKLSGDNAILQEKVEDLIWSKQSLMNKYIELNSELLSLKEQFKLEKRKIRKVINVK